MSFEGVVYEFWVAFCFSSILGFRVHELEIFVKCWDCLLGFWTSQTCREGLIGFIYRLKYL